MVWVRTINSVLHIFIKSMCKDYNIKYQHSTIREYTKIIFIRLSICYELGVVSFLISLFFLRLIIIIIIICIVECVLFDDG